MATTRPAAQSTIIKRPRLTKQLDGTQARILLLGAPAGYGKTTLAREWLAARSGPAAWYRGGIEMLDAAAVARSLVEALATVGMPEADVARLLERTSRVNKPADLGRAIGAAMPKRTGALLVIDDYHHAAESPDSETLVGAFVEQTDLRLLITSRTRPAWLESRMQVYGEAFVLGADELAFTDDEAAEVMAGVAPKRSDSFVAQARGWPAVIGLAARRKDGGPRRESRLLPAELYDYFADDLLRRASAELHDSLYLLALIGGSESRVAKDLLDEDYDKHLTEAVEAGFVSWSGITEFEMHPLLRRFLLAKLTELEDASRTDLISRALRSLGRGHKWDECLVVLDSFPGLPLAATLLEEALDELLADGRLATIKRWLKLSPRDDHERPVLLLAEAEVALREGHDSHAQVIAEQAAKLSLSSELAAQAHLVAARAAHMRSDSAGRQQNARRATELSRLARVRRDARWLEWLDAYETENGRAREVWELLREESDGTPEQELRLKTAEGSLALEVEGDIRKSVRGLEASIGLLPHVSDPLARTSFLHFTSMANVYMCEYERAIELGEAQLEEVRTTGLDFATGHALLIRMSALVGLRKIGAAKHVLRQIQTRAKDESAHVIVVARMQEARLHASSGDIRRAETLLRSPVPSGLDKGTHGEAIANRALYLASLGEVEAARSAARAAIETSSYAGTRMLSDLALAVASIQDESGATSTTISEETVARAVRHGQLDLLVQACRAFPQLAKSGIQNESLSQNLTQALASSHDVDIARRAGLSIPRELRRNDGLSTRERDVYELLRQGRTNREIAEVLFLSESTIKLHVRHIFEKLRVHSRAEAAAAGLDDAV